MAFAVVLARSRGHDLTKDQVLDEALHDVAAVVDIASVATMGRKAATGFFTTVTGNLLEAPHRGRDTRPWRGRPGDG